VLIFIVLQILVTFTKEVQKELNFILRL